ncbi:MAG: hypothetical protein P0Y53_15255 [Candidatus Pseudobacter hemicellulosilyticus]|uniref:Uncharacterized protein n=1 Tax=Candidatus Pseudobacter hemicellulosilyticus TaxID=3121375 RepID=A0AAJ6BDP1_9BACT|nr:MAG: hypothetical protein P0Y53_15255 [Pseudobacter sp.]
MHNYSYRWRLASCFIACLFVALMACKKETEYRNEPVQALHSFSITAGETILEAAIKDDSLVVYWPWPVLLPETISPVISLAAGASISPASGTAVPLTTGTRYTLKKEDGSEQVYYLKLVNNWPALDTRYIKNTVNSGRGERLNLSGLRYFIGDKEKTSMSLISRINGEETPLNIETITDRTIGGRLPQTLPIDTDYDQGHWVKLVNAGRTLEMKEYIIYIVY